MKFAPIFAALAIAALAPAAVHAEDTKPAAEKTADAYIPFANHGGVRDWRAIDSKTIYFQDQHKRWYKAELFSTAFDLPFTEFLGLDTSPGDQLDRWSGVYVRGQRYTFRTFEAIDGQPPKKAKKATKEAAPAE